MHEHTCKTGFMIAILADASLHSGGVGLDEEVRGYPEIKPLKNNILCHIRGKTTNGITG
jgi:hypothetical protein